MHQHGLVTYQQVLDAGGSPHAIDHRVDSGAWSRVRTGVYAVGAVPATWERSVAAACLAAGPDVVASHRTAARLWGFVSRSGLLQVSVADRRRVRIPGVKVHRSRQFGDQDRTRHQQIPVTTIARTIVDLAPTLGAEVIGRWIDRARQDHGLSLVELGDCCSRLTIRGRPTPTSAIRALAERLPGQDPGRSALEARALAALARERLPAPVCQHPVRRPDGTMAYIDLAYPSCALAIELDGWEHHGIRAAFDADRWRGNDLVLAGWHLLRFTWTMSDAYLCQTVRSALSRTGVI